MCTTQMYVPNALPLVALQCAFGAYFATFAGTAYGTVETVEPVTGVKLTRR